MTLPHCTKSKWLTLAVLFQSNKMEKKDIIIFTALLLLTGLSLYRRYMKKRSDAGAFSANKPPAKNSLSAQPDDYEPYTGKKQPD